MEFVGGVVGESEGDNIWCAASDGDINRVLSLISSGVDVNSQDETGYSPIHAAVSYGHTELIQALLNVGANPNLRDEDGDTPLHVCEAPDVAELLIVHGADPTAVNAEGDTIFDKAEEDENPEMIEYWTGKGLANRGPNNPGPSGEETEWGTLEEGDEEDGEEEDEEGAEGGEDDQCEDIDVPTHQG